MNWIRLCMCVNVFFVDSNTPANLIQLHFSLPIICIFLSLIVGKLVFFLFMSFERKPNRESENAYSSIIWIKAIAQCHFICVFIFHYCVKFSCISIACAAHNPNSNPNPKASQYNAFDVLYLQQLTDSLTLSPAAIHFVACFPHFQHHKLPPNELRCVVSTIFFHFAHAVVILFIIVVVVVVFFPYFFRLFSIKFANNTEFRSCFSCVFLAESWKSCESQCICRRAHIFSFSFSL